MGNRNGIVYWKPPVSTPVSLKEVTWLMTILTFGCGVSIKVAHKLSSTQKFINLLISSKSSWQNRSTHCANWILCKKKLSFSLTFKRKINTENTQCTEKDWKTVLHNHFPLVENIKTVSVNFNATIEWERQTCQNTTTFVKFVALFFYGEISEFLRFSEFENENDRTVEEFYSIESWNSFF